MEQRIFQRQNLELTKMKSVTVNSPDWLKKSAVYQINPRTFSKEGTIDAVRRELPKLKEMGFKIMYLCPIFEEDPSEDRVFWSKRQIASETGNPKNPYRMNDYFKIDSEYGTMEDLEGFVRDAHALDMKVLLDLVYLHIGPNATILQRHPEFAQQNEDGSFKCTVWNFPLLDYNCQGLREYMWCNMTYYIGVIDVDGFRCDVPDGVPDDFWVEGRRRITAIKPDAVLIAEGRNYGRLATCFNSSYNFLWHEYVYRIFRGDETATLEGLIAQESEALSRVPKGGLLLRDIDNHDTATDWPKRTELVAGHDGMELIEVLNYSFSGIPMVYSGNELADTSYHSMFANRFYMGKFETTDRKALYGTPDTEHRIEVMKRLNLLLLENDAMHSPEIEWISNSEGEKVLSYKKIGETESLVFVGCFKREKVDVKLNCEIKNREILMSNNAEIKGEEITFEGYGYLLLKV